MLLLGINALYMFFCFFKQFLMASKELKKQRKEYALCL